MKKLNYEEDYHFTTNDFNQEMLDRVSDYADSEGIFSYEPSAKWLCFDAGEGNFYTTSLPCSADETVLTKQQFNEELDHMLAISTIKKQDEEYTLEARDNGMLPPIGSKAILCVGRGAIAEDTTKALSGEQVLVISHNKSSTLATCFILDKYGNVISSLLANNQWFKPIEVVVDKDEKTLDALKLLISCKGTRIALVSMIKGGDVPHMYYKEEG